MNKLNLIFSCFLFLCLHSIAGGSDNLTVVAIGDAKVEKEFIGIGEAKVPKSLKANDKRQVDEFLAIIKNDFMFYRKFIDVKNISNRENNGTLLKSKGFSYFIRTNILSSNPLKLEYELYNVKTSKVVTKGSVTLSSLSLRVNAHTVADKFYRSIFGKKSIFLSRIVFVSDRTSRRGDTKKELYIMDFDGASKTRLTFHNGTVISPAISASGKQILYSLIKHERSKRRNINLYLYDLASKRTSLISSRKGINSGAVFMPGDKEIALTLSHTGNAEIYVMNLATSRLRKLTSHFSADVDPSIAPNGTKMAFLSGRPGKAMIYTLDPTGTEKNIKRIGFVGRFNATPRFSPDSKIIAFSSWVDNRFDIFRLNADGSNLSRLTKDFGSNEDPSFSNDGNFLAFSSQRVLSRKRALQNVYIMDIDGEIIGSVTKNYGNCITPRWSKYP